MNDPRIARRSLLIAAAAGSALAAQYASASTWVPTAAGTYNWTDVGNWDTVPNASSAIANFNIPIAGAQTVNADVAGVTVGTVTVGDTTAAPGSAYSFNNKIIFNNGASSAVLTKVGAATDVFFSPFELASDLTIDMQVASVTNLTVRGGITETVAGRQLIKNGPGRLDLRGANSYTGKTILNGGRIQVNASGSVIPGDLDINTGTIFQQFSNNAIVDTSTVTINSNGSYNTSFSTETIGALKGTGNNANVGGQGSLTFGGLNIDTTFSGYTNGAGTVLTKVGTGSFQLTGPRSNGAGGAFNAFGGRVDLNKPAATTHIAITGPLNIGNGTDPASVRLMKAEQLANHEANSEAGAGTFTSNMTLNQGTFNLNGYSETAGTLTTSGVSAIDFGADALDGTFGPGSSVLKFDDSSALTWSGTLSVLNWGGLAAGGGPDQLIFFDPVSLAGTALTGTQLSLISFVDPAGLPAGSYGATQLSSGEVVPVPEPAALGLLALGALGLVRRRRNA